jgi:hypothetical protein
MVRMKAEDVRQFMARDWSRISAAKTAAWLERKRGRTAADWLADADALWRYARTLRPDWPTAEDRADDLAAHGRVAGMLRAVQQRPR